jgi:hypothetical protein
MPQAEAKESARNVCFPWHPLEAAMSICYVGFFKSFFIILELIKAKETAISAES